MLAGSGHGVRCGGALKTSTGFPAALVVGTLVLAAQACDPPENVNDKGSSGSTAQSSTGGNGGTATSKAVSWGGSSSSSSSSSGTSASSASSSASSTSSGSSSSSSTSGGTSRLCGPCSTYADCDPGAYCLRNGQTGTIFCGQDCSASPCPATYTCTTLQTGSGAIVHQCIPAGGTCTTTSSSSSTGGSSSSSSSSSSASSTGGGNNADLQHCADVINSYRATLSLAPVTRSAAIEAYAAVGAEYDSTRAAHSHFQSTSGGGVCNAENEAQNWSGTPTSVIDGATQMMWNEGPGGGHYENIRGSHSTVGCGFFISPSGQVTMVQDFL